MKGEGDVVSHMAFGFPMVFTEWHCGEWDAKAPEDTTTADT